MGEWKVITEIYRNNEKKKEVAVIKVQDQNKIIKESKKKNKVRKAKEKEKDKVEKVDKKLKERKHKTEVQENICSIQRRDNNKGRSAESSRTKLCTIYLRWRDILKISK